MDKNPYERLESLLPETDELGIDGYETVAPIGEGGFGRVYRARQTAFARDVAVKVLAASGMKDETVRRFERECRAIGTLSGHPNIVTIYDSGISRWGRPYIVMDHMSGGSFGDLLGHGETVDVQSAVEVIVKIAGAVETAHRAGILHRDIKPENILLSAYGEPKLADFGVASIPGGYQTHTGAITASLAHAAPEVLEGEKATRAIDVYALGSTLFSLIEGHAAFSSTDDGGLQSLIARTLTQPVPDLRAQGVPDGVCQVLERSMAKSPADRYDSMEAMALALQSAQAAAGWTVTEMPVERTALVAYPSEPAVGPESRTQVRNRRELTPPQPASPPKRVVWRSPVFAAALVLLLALSSGSVIVLRSRDRARPLPAVSPAGEPTDLVADTGAEDDDGSGTAPRKRVDRRKRQPEGSNKKRRSARDGGTLALAGPAGGSYAPPSSGGGGGSYSPPSGGGSTGGSGGASSGGSAGGGSNGGGGSGGGSQPQPQPEPEPQGSERPADIPIWYHWNDDNGQYFFTANYNESMSKLGTYDNRTVIGRVWSTAPPGSGLAPFCPRPADPCYGYTAKEPPKEGSYLTLYYHPGNGSGRFFSTNAGATYRGEPLSFYGYIRPPG